MSAYCKSSGELRHAVILCHPASQSFNHSIAEAYCETVAACGQSSVIRNLYELDFDPVLRNDERPTVGADLRADVTREFTQLTGSDVFVLVYPIWFGSPPAMLKGYVERVFGAGVTPQNVLLQNRLGFLTGKRLLSFTTSATSDIWLDEQGQMQSLRQVFDRYIAHAFGMQIEKHVTFGHIVPGTSARVIEQNLFDVKQEARRVCAELLATLRRTPASASLGAA
jgi:NAD(P)H dehydrogenase (quinone)